MRNTLTQKGFTFIELIIVFTVTMILGSIGIASFVTYSNSQQLRNTSSDIVNMLQSARSASLSQAHSGDCTSQGQNFVGYEVQLCGKSGTCVQNGNDYELDLVCSTLVKAIQTGKFPTGTGKVSLNVAATSRGVFSFLAVSGFTTSGQIVLTGYQNQQKTITITTTGVVSQQ